MVQYRESLEGINEEQLKGFFVGWRKPLSEAQHLAMLANSSHVVLAFDAEQQRVVGFINALSDRVQFAFIPLLEVMPTHQHRGIGTELTRRLLTALEPITCIDLTCSKPLQPFYAKFGMIPSNGMVIRKYLLQ